MERRTFFGSPCIAYAVHQKHVAFLLGGGGHLNIARRRIFCTGGEERVTLTLYKVRKADKEKLGGGTQQRGESAVDGSFVIKKCIFSMFSSHFHRPCTGDPSPYRQIQREEGLLF